MYSQITSGKRILLARAFYCACASLLFAAHLSAQGGPEGHWEGSFTANNNQIGVSLDLAKNAKSEWIASMGMPSEKMTGLVVMDVKVSGNSVTFTAVELQMAKSALTLGPDGQMKGTFAGPQGSPIPVELKRTGAAKVELIPASPAVAKEFEGDWQGALQTPGRTFQIIFHFRNQPDKTVAATIDTPDTGGFGLPLNDVKQTGKQIEFGIKIAHAEFKGILNQESTEIAGQFGHEKQFAPLTLKKSVER
jgi:hypothetical protein